MSSPDAPKPQVLKDSGLADWQLRPARLQLHPTTWIAPGAVLAGDITLGEKSSVWYGCVLRGDLEPIVIGSETNIQDLTTVHVDYHMPALIGDRVTIGHRCVIHGCTIEDDVLIGIGAVLLSGSKIGRGSVVAAGAVVRENFEVPPGSFVAGVPARIRGEVTEEMSTRIRLGTASYVAHTEWPREDGSAQPAGPEGGPQIRKEGQT